MTRMKTYLHQGWMVLALVWILAGCREAPTPTQTILSVNATEHVRAQISRLGVRVDNVTQDMTPSINEQVPSPNWPLKLAIVPRAGDAARWFAVTLEAFRAQESAAFLTVKLQTGFVKGHKYYTALILDDACVTGSNPQACGAQQTCVGDLCVGSGTVDPHQLSPEPSACLAGQSACGADGVCADTLNDAANCGACSNVCSQGAVCQHGTCSDRPCPAGETSCSGSCAALADDANNCGTCGRTCEDGSACVSGQCVQQDCSAELSDNCNGACTSVLNDWNHCGACGHSCEVGQLCSAGQCHSAPDISIGGAICSLKSDGTVFCASAEGRPQLQYAEGETSRRVSNIENARQVSVGKSHACALLSDQTVQCWGDNSVGQLGDGTQENRQRPVQVQGLPRDIVYLATSPTGSGGGEGDTTCAMSKDTTVYCWGEGASGQFGDMTTVLNSATALRGSDLRGVAEVQPFGHGVCARMIDGSVWCWGSQALGGLADGETGYVSQPEPRAVEGLSHVRALTGMAFGACALLDDSGVQCWGDNTWGAVGDGTTEDTRPTPTPVVNLSRVTSIASGSTHVCAVLDDTTAACWGNDGYGQLGDGPPEDTSTKTQSHVPVQVLQAANRPLTGVASIAAGDGQTCARMLDGTSRCWGDALGSFGTDRDDLFYPPYADTVAGF